MRTIIVVAGCFTWLMTSCTGSDYKYEAPCIHVPRYGLNVTIELRNGAGSNTTEGITIVATESSYSETLSVITSPVFSGAYDRVGTYAITVSKEGYQTNRKENIVVGYADGCSISARNIHFNFEPL
jgi:hypothetical protein